MDDLWTLYSGSDKNWGVAQTGQTGQCFEIFTGPSDTLLALRVVKELNITKVVQGHAPAPEFFKSKRSSEAILKHFKGFQTKQKGSHIKLNYTYLNIFTSVIRRKKSCRDKM